MTSGSHRAFACGLCLLGLLFNRASYAQDADDRERLRPPSGVIPSGEAPKAEERLTLAAPPALGGRRPAKFSFDNPKAAGVEPDHSLALAQRERDRSGTARDAVPWQVEPDPAAPGQILPQDARLGIEIPHLALPRSSRSKAVQILYPATPSVHVAVGMNQLTTQSRHVWDLGSRKKLGTIKGLQLKSSNRLALSPDGKYFAGSPEKSNVVGIWDVDAAKAVRTVTLPVTGEQSLLEFAADNRIVVVVGKTLYVLSTPSGNRERQVDLARTVPTSSAYFGYAWALSPGGRYLAIADRSRMDVLFVDVTTGKTAGRIDLTQETSVGWIAADFSDDGKRTAFLLDGSLESSIQVWDVAGGRIVSAFRFDGSLTEIAEGQKDYQGPSVDWFPDGRRLLVYGRGIFDTESGELVLLPAATLYRLRPLGGDLLAIVEKTRLAPYDLNQSLSVPLKAVRDEQPADYGQQAADRPELPPPQTDESPVGNQRARGPRRVESRAATAEADSGADYDETLEQAIGVLSSGNASQAEELLAPLTIAEPERKEAWLWLGHARKRQLKWEPARDAFKQFASLAPQDVEGAREVAETYERENETELARFWYKKALDIDPSNRDVADAISRLDSASRPAPAAATAAVESAGTTAERDAAQRKGFFQNGLVGLCGGRSVWWGRVIALTLFSLALGNVSGRPAANWKKTPQKGAAEFIWTAAFAATFLYVLYWGIPIDVGGWIWFGVCTAVCPWMTAVIIKQQRATSRTDLANALNALVQSAATAQAEAASQQRAITTTARTLTRTEPAPPHNAPRTIPLAADGREPSLHDALLNAVCCVMVADGTASKVEKQRVRELMTQAAAPWTDAETEERIGRFIKRVKDSGFRQTLDVTCDELAVVNKAGKGRVVLQFIDAIARVDGELHENERRVCDRIRSSLA